MDPLFKKKDCPSVIIENKYLCTNVRSQEKTKENVMEKKDIQTRIYFFYIHFAGYILCSQTSGGQNGGWL